MTRSDRKVPAMDRAKTVLIVTFFTLLVWVFAEGESLTARERQVEVEFIAEDERRIVRIADGQPWTGSVSLSIHGSISAVDRLEDALRAAITLPLGMEEVPSSTGTHDVELKDALRAHPEIRDSGATIVRVEPQRVRIEVDQIVRVDMPVRVDVPDAETDGDPVPSRSSVRIAMPGRLAERLPEEPEAVARVPRAALERLVPGQAGTVRGVPLELPEPLRGMDTIRIDPSQVDVRLTLRSRTDTLEIKTVPLHLRVAAFVYGQYEIEIDPEDQFLRDLKLTGPARVIEQIRRGDLPTPVAVVSLTPDELERGVETRTAELINIPPGVQYTIPNRLVRLRISRRDAPDNSPDGP